MGYHANQGDIIWIDLDPQSGHEQMGRRPAIVVSNNTFNNWSSCTAMVCPITNRDRGIPIHVKLENRTQTTGVIMCDQAKILDIQMRNAVFVEKVPQDILEEVVDIINGFIEIEKE